MENEDSDLELTVVVPCYNVEATLAEQLDALVQQSWDGRWEVLVVDNGSTDGTAKIAASYVGGEVPVRIVAAIDGQGVAYARNAGICAARSELVVICDGDDVVQPGWVAAMGDALRTHQLVGGVVDPSLVNEAWLARTRPMGTAGQLPQFGGQSFVSGGNCGLRRSLWDSLGGYDEDFRGLEDIEFSLRARAHGIDPVLVEQAVMGYRYREGIGSLWRQGFFYGRGRRELSRRAKTLGLPGASPVAAFKSWAWLALHLPKLVSRSGRYEWTWVLANRVGAIRGLLDNMRAVPDGTHLLQARGLEGDTSYHGVLITYRRPDDLRRSLSALASQTKPLDSLVVVDNDNDPDVAKLVAAVANETTEIHYLATSENMGPAGGIHAGTAHVLARASPQDWIVLLDDDDPPQRNDCFEALQKLLDAARTRDRRCAGIGLWGATLNRWTGRLRVAVGTHLEQVAYLPGGSCPHYAVEALRVVGAPEPEMFFGFDDLELGLRFRDAGLRLYSSGIARDHGLSSMVEGRRASGESRPPTWRRYYSLRNLVVVLRSHRNTFGAVTMSVMAGVAKPLFNLARDPSVALANLRLNARALRDGWAGRLGRTVDPDPSGAAAPATEGATG